MVVKTIPSEIRKLNELGGAGHGITSVGWYMSMFDISESNMIASDEGGGPLVRILIRMLIRVEAYFSVQTCMSQSLKREIW